VGGQSRRAGAAAALTVFEGALDDRGGLLHRGTQRAGEFVWQHVTRPDKAAPARPIGEDLHDRVVMLRVHGVSHQRVDNPARVVVAVDQLLTGHGAVGKHHHAHAVDDVR
jgi:hypothetical protein